MIDIKHTCSQHSNVVASSPAPSFSMIIEKQEGLGDKIYGSREGHSEASPNSLRSLAEHGTSTLRRSHLRSFAELTPTLRRSHLRSFADASPNSAPILRRSHLRSFAELTPRLRRSHLRSFAELSSDTSPKSPPKLRRTQLRYFAEVTSEASPNYLTSFAEAYTTKTHFKLY